MKKPRALALLAIILCWSLSVMPQAAAPDNTASRAVVLMDGETGQILYQKNMDQQMYPASTTKVMTALLAVENTDSNAYVTVSESALDIDEPNSSNVGLVVGERLTVRDTLYGLMLRSANEAANVLAEYIAGSQEEFSRMMNEKAVELGAVNTNFVNPHGLHEAEHYTTAYDLALITRYAAANPDFSQYYSSATYQMQPTNMHPDARTIENHMYMLFDYSPYYNETVVGGKTGFTDEAKNTLVTVAEKDGQTLVCVVMYSEAAREKFDDTSSLLAYGFDDFYPYTVTGDTFSEFAIPVGTQDSVLGNALLSYNEDITLYLPQGVTPDMLEINYERADIFADEEDASGYITFSLPAGSANGLPTEILRMPMDVDVRMQSVSVMAPATEKSRFSLPDILTSLAGMILPFFGLTVAIAAVLTLGVFLIRYRNVRRTRKQRMDRMERVRQRRQEIDSLAASAKHEEQATPAPFRTFASKDVPSRAGRNRSSHGEVRTQPHGSTFQSGPYRSATARRSTSSSARTGVGHTAEHGHGAASRSRSGAYTTYSTAARRSAYQSRK